MDTLPLHLFAIKSQFFSAVKKKPSLISICGHQSCCQKIMDEVAAGAAIEAVGIENIAVTHFSINSFQGLFGERLQLTISCVQRYKGVYQEKSYVLIEEQSVF